MIASGNTHTGSANLLRTYFALGEASPGAKHHLEPGFEYCTGPYDHPICNFAANLSLDRMVANRIFDIALDCPHFNVYSLDGDVPMSRFERQALLVESGFEKCYELTQMGWTPSCPAHQPQIQPERGSDKRNEIASFMALQFFPKYSSGFRRRIFEATALAQSLELYGIYLDGQLVAASMLSEDESSIGLFNVCVDTAYRGRGLGRNLVAAAQFQAYEKQKFVCLQCNESLITWYENQGFRTSGIVDVFGLPDKRRTAIMK
ncbi:MAG TPA: GNAT family N-acetyltransferase [Fimbriimonadaceae bacterium]|nr:GNAT family N-acetyltransferase [Fimbriimonadaceae bacterium]